ncbi:MAG: hypothetical protein K6A65_04370, partial [Succinivibrionaceae bacterium]|nr:hypothetical protein [Succinivibrionaceae bacterium]
MKLKAKTMLTAALCIIAAAAGGSLYTLLVDRSHAIERAIEAQERAANTFMLGLSRAWLSRSVHLAHEVSAVRDALKEKGVMLQNFVDKAIEQRLDLRYLIYVQSLVLSQAGVDLVTMLGDEQLTQSYHRNLGRSATSDGLSLDDILRGRLDGKAFHLLTSPDGHQYLVYAFPSARNPSLRMAIVDNVDGMDDLPRQTLDQLVDSLRDDFRILGSQAASIEDSHGKILMESGEPGTAITLSDSDQALIRSRDGMQLITDSRGSHLVHAAYFAPAGWTVTFSTPRGALEGSTSRNSAVAAGAGADQGLVRVGEGDGGA